MVTVQVWSMLPDDYMANYAAFFIFLFTVAIPVSGDRNLVYVSFYVPPILVCSFLFHSLHLIS